MRFVDQMMLQWKFTKNSKELNSPSRLKSQSCGNKILKSSVTSSINLVYVDAKLAEVWNFDSIDNVAE